MSPDLNPIEHLWKELKHANWRRHPSNLRQLEQFAHKEWAKIPVDRCRSLIESYRNRLIAVIASKGRATKNIKLRVPSFLFYYRLFLVVQHYPQGVPTSRN